MKRELTMDDHVYSEPQKVEDTSSGSYFCPTCGEKIDKVWPRKYCVYCGQCLDWSATAVEILNRVHGEWDRDKNYVLSWLE